MMKTRNLLYWAVVVLLSVSCSSRKQSSAIRMDNFVNNVASSCENYSNSQWETVEKQYEALLGEVERNYDTMTPEERSVALEATGRYSALLLKYGLYSVAQETVRYLKGLEPLMKGFEDGLEAADGLDWDSLFDSLSDDDLDFDDDDDDPQEGGAGDSDEDVF